MSLIPIRGNLLGIAMLVLTAPIAAVGGLVLRLSDPLVMGAVGLALIAMDFLIRLRHREAAGWWRVEGTGGYLFFAPVWALGLFVVALNLINAFFPEWLT